MAAVEDYGGATVYQKGYVKLDRGGGAEQKLALPSKLREKHNPAQFLWRRWNCMESYETRAFLLNDLSQGGYLAHPMF